MAQTFYLYVNLMKVVVGHHQPTIGVE